MATAPSKIIDWVVETAIVTMLTRAPFKDMKDAAAFERWFDDRLPRYVSAALRFGSFDRGNAEPE